MNLEYLLELNEDLPFALSLRNIRSLGERFTPYFSLESTRHYSQQDTIKVHSLIDSCNIIDLMGKEELFKEVKDNYPDILEAMLVDDSEIFINLFCSHKTGGVIIGTMILYFVNELGEKDSLFINKHLRGIILSHIGEHTEERKSDMYTSNVNSLEEFSLLSILNSIPNPHEVQLVHLLGIQEHH